VIEVQNVTKRYGPITAVNDVSFRVEPGQILGFLGPNGAGKTTTMRILTGCIPPTDGRALIAGFDVFDEPVEAKRRTGYLPETPPLYPDMTVREYLTFASRISGVKASDRAGRIDFAMGRTNIADVASRHCGKLSKGYRQRVGLAQAILHNPDVLILDEPTAGLDPKQIIETRELIKDLAGDHTIILSTHILPEVSQTCMQVVIINKGHVVAVDTPENLTGRLGGSETIRLEVDTLGSDATLALEQLAGVVSVSVSPGSNGTSVVDVQVAQGADVRQHLANTIVSNGWGLLELRRMKMSLEDIFLELTTQDEAVAATETAVTGEPEGDTRVETTPEKANE
jgi:ABC-2 type transport system ATP-binding protein